MQLPISKRDAFPPEVLELLQAFHRAGFFEDSMLIGSWVMPLYQQAFGMRRACGWRKPLRGTEEAGRRAENTKCKKH